jgi:DNA-directed RNA polymerase specialized sigma24 family protein
LWNQRVNEEAWLRLNRSAAMGNIENLGGWLTTVIGRVCLDMLRSRKSRREESPGGPFEEIACGKAAGEPRPAQSEGHGPDSRR